LTKPLPTYSCPVKFWAVKNPDQRAVLGKDDSENLTYGQLNESVDRAEKLLQSASDKFLIVQAWNSAPLIVQLFAAWRANKLVVLLSPRTPSVTVRAIENQLEAYFSSTESDELAESSESSGSAETNGSRVEGSTPHRASAMLTSGSSGQPKLIVHSTHNHLNSAVACNQRLGIQGNDIWLWSLPAFHVGGLSILWRCFLAGAAVQFFSKGEKLSTALGMAAPTIISLVPTQLQELISEGFRCPPDLRSVIVGGAPITPQLLQDAISLGYPIRTTYGLTETSSMVTLSEPWMALSEPIHAGKPLDGVDLSISGEGRIHIQSDVVRMGEFVDGNYVPATHSFTTQDTGALSLEGHLVVGPRQDDVIISGGENISLGLIEATILRHPAILTCRVIAQPHVSYGFRPIAFVKWKRSKQPEVQSLTHFLEQELDKIAVPDFILELPDPEEGFVKVSLAQLTEIASKAINTHANHHS